MLLLDIIDAQVKMDQLHWFNKFDFWAGRDVICEDMEGFTSPHVAVSIEEGRCAELLLQRGANAAATSRVQRTPPYYAAKAASVGIISNLIQHGADINSRDGGLTTASMMATMQDTTVVLEKLH